MSKNGTTVICATAKNPLVEQKLVGLELAKINLDLVKLELLIAQEEKEERAFFGVDQWRLEELKKRFEAADKVDQKEGEKVENGFKKESSE